METISSQLVGQLIDKAFENLSNEERLDFIGELFSKIPGEGQQSLLRGMLESISPSSAATLSLQPKFIHFKVLDDVLQDNGPWGMCCNMMLDIDRAKDLDLMDASRPTRLFTALGDETRIRIIKLLSGGEMPVDSICKELEVAQPTVSHHLKILREAELLQSDKRGRSVFYSLTRPIQVSFA